MNKVCSKFVAEVYFALLKYWKHDGRAYAERMKDRNSPYLTCSVVPTFVLRGDSSRM